jgi:hypothetical protein
LFNQQQHRRFEEEEDENDQHAPQNQQHNDLLLRLEALEVQLKKDISDGILKSHKEHAELKKTLINSSSSDARKNNNDDKNYNNQVNDKLVSMTENNATYFRPHCPKFLQTLGNSMIGPVNMERAILEANCHRCATSLIMC